MSSIKTGLKRLQSGFSLPEMLLGFTIFLLFLGGVFGLFTKGYQAFHFLQTRQSLQAEVLRLKNVMEADFCLTHFRSTGIEVRTTAIDEERVERDQVCCLILSNWSDAANYRPGTSIPLWNRYALYQTSLDEQGRLERLVLAPDLPVPYRIRPLDDLTNFGAGDLVGRQLLSSNVRAFSAKRDPFLQQVVITIELKQTGAHRGLAADSTKETFKAVFHWAPNNTVPRL